MTSSQSATEIIVLLALEWKGFYHLTLSLSCTFTLTLLKIQKTYVFVKEIKWYLDGQPIVNSSGSFFRQWAFNLYWWQMQFIPMLFTIMERTDFTPANMCRDQHQCHGNVTSSSHTATITPGPSTSITRHSTIVIQVCKTHTICSQNREQKPPPR